MNICRAFLDFLSGVVLLIAIFTVCVGIKHHVYVAVFFGSIEVIMAKGLFDIATKLSNGEIDDTTCEA